MKNSKFGQKFLNLFKRSKNNKEESHQLSDQDKTLPGLSQQDGNEELSLDSENLENDQSFETFDEAEEFASLEENEEFESLEESESFEALEDSEFDSEFDENSLELHANKELDDNNIIELPPLPVDTESDDDSFEDIPPEVHAEKTLRTINLEKFRQENAHLKNDYSESDHTIPDLDFNELKPELETKKKLFNLKKIEFSNKPSLNWVAFQNFFSKFNKSEGNEFSNILSTENRPKIHSAFLIVFTSVSAYMVGRSIALVGSTFIQSKDNKQVAATIITKRPLYTQEINKITSTNLFGLKNTEGEVANETPRTVKDFICKSADKPTGEPITLLDTIVIQDSVKSMASVQIRGQKDLLNVREGEKINGNLEVSRIQRLRLILKNTATGECEYVQANELNEAPVLANMKILPPSQASRVFKSTNPEIKNEGNTFKIKNTYRNKMLGNLSEILTQAKAIQITNPDGSLSFKMTEVTPGSIYSQLNIQNDDIITSINGKKIENLNELTSLLGRIREIDHFQIGLRRNGNQENLEYKFE